MADIRRILLDGYPTVMVREGDTSGCARRALDRGRRGRAPVAGGADEDHLLPPQPRQPGARVRRLAAARAHLLPQADQRAQRHRAAVVRPSNCKWLNYEGEMAIVIGRTCRNVTLRRGGRLHRRLHGRQRLRPARLPRHRQRQHAAREGRRHAVPARARPGHRLGLPRQAHPHARQRRGEAGRQHRRDGVGHALPRRRHRPPDHARARRRHPLRHAGHQPHRATRATW